MSEEARRLGDRYELGETLGKGGMAEVHEGRDLRLGRRVAIKILRPDLATDPMFLQRFRREAQSAASLNHPNIVAVYDTGEDILGTGPSAVRVPYIVMEVVDGMTLRQLLQSGRRILPERALEITSGVLAALDYSHRHGIIHRDIKPANVMVTNNGDVKVMDFGIARAVADAGNTMTTTSTVLGTAQYLSPEQAKGEVVDSRSDLYSAGIVLYELLAGRPPFQGESPVAVAYQHVSEEAAPPSRWDPAVPMEADSICARAMMKDPNQRYQSATEFRSDVERAIAGAPVTTMLPRTVEPAPAVENLATQAIPAVPAAPVMVAEPPAPSAAEKKSSPWLWIGIVAAVLAVVGGIVWLATGSGSPAAEMAKVPNLVGLTASSAETSLLNAGFKLGTQTAQVSDKPKDTVIAQDPVAGESLEKGQSVDIQISAGKEQVTTPNLVGMTSEADARTALEDAGLLLGSVDEKDSDRPEGHVIGQDPVKNTPVDKGSRVNIVVSTARVKVPDVVNADQSQAMADLSNAGFEISAQTQTTDTASPGVVIRQSPAAGTVAKKGTIVTIIVARAPDATPTPTPTPSISVSVPADTPSGTATDAGNGTATSATVTPAPAQPSSSVPVQQDAVPTASATPSPTKS